MFFFLSFLPSPFRSPYAAWQFIEASLCKAKPSFISFPKFVRYIIIFIVGISTRLRLLFLLVPAFVYASIIYIALRRASTPHTFIYMSVVCSLLRCAYVPRKTEWRHVVYFDVFSFVCHWNRNITFCCWTFKVCECEEREKQKERICVEDSVQFHSIYFSFF